MMKELTQEQKDRIFQKLIVSASDILCEEFGLPHRTFAEIQEMLGKQNGENDYQDVSEL